MTSPSPSPLITSTRTDRVRTSLWANLAAQVGIVITGGAVRLTGSGLGCSTWPQCEPGHFTPELHAATSIHRQIEFGNRTLTMLLTMIAAWVAVLVWRRTDRNRSFRLLGLVPLAGVLLQALIGGLSVLTDLHPAIVGSHLLISMALVAVSTALIVRYGERDGRPVAVAPALDRRLGGALGAVAAVVLTLGVVVTGAGPHSGDPDKASRFNLDPVQMARVHALAVWCFVALLAILVVRLRSKDLVQVHKPLTALVAVTLAQVAIGYLQYANALPELLVGAHMLGAALLTATTTWTILSMRVRSGPV